MLDIIGYRKFFVGVSVAFMVASWSILALFGLRYGIDFTGGSLLEVEYSTARPPADEIKKALESLNLGALTVQPTGDRGAFVRFRDVDEATHQAILRALADAAPSERIEERRFDAIGPVIGHELKRKAMWALALAVVMIIFYIAWAFRRVSEPVSSWKYGVVAVVALIHNISIPTAVFSLLGAWRGVEIDALFITALLTVMGFSVHDTIVVFDRIREKLRALKVSEPYAATVNRSINETLTRSINTSLTVLFVLFALLFWGGETLYYFTLALIIGIAFGTYSSIFFASPLLVAWHHLTNKR